MGRADYLKLGDWNAVCFRCGFKFKAAELRKEWEGFYVHGRCWEPRQPQDFAKGVPDIQTVPWSQPSNWVYVGPAVALCDIPTKSAIPSLMGPGCSVPGNTVTGFA